MTDFSFLIFSMSDKQSSKENKTLSKNDTPKAVAGVSKELQEMYGKSKDLGSENIQSALFPVLKILQKEPDELASPPELANGVTAKKGQLYHSASKQVFDEIEVHALYTQPCQLPVYNPENKNELIGKQQYVVLVVGYIPSLNQPFLTYVKGKSLGGLFEWQQHVNEYKESYNIPMYALKNSISAQKEKNSFGTFYVFTFNVKMDESNSYPIINEDVELAKTLEKMVPLAKKGTTMAIEIAQGKISQETQDELDKQAVTVEENTEDVSEEDIDFDK